MRSNTVTGIKQAIGTLTPAELQELCMWLDQHPHPLDVRMESDLAAGLLDEAIEQALRDERDSRVQPL